MSTFFRSKTYNDDVFCAIERTVDKHKLTNSSILVTGATGLIGSFIVDMLLKLNTKGANISIIATGRSISKLEENYGNDKRYGLRLVEYDVCKTPEFDIPVDYIIHAASNAYPALFREDPVGTIITNVVGTKQLLDYGIAHDAKRLLYVSSGEVYGQGDISLDSYTEDYCGYVDPMACRSCYPNAKRTAETLCIAYTQQYGLETVIVRPSHTYGPNATKKDNRANAEFIRKGFSGENIVMTSAGEQMRSYTYVGDTSSAILSVLLKGKTGEAYNIANKQSTISIAGFANEVARQTNTKVIFAMPDEISKAEMSPIAKQVLDNRKLESLGWRGQYDIEMGIRHTLKTLKELHE